MGRKELEQWLRDGECVYTARADRDIERHRKGDFELVLYDEKGELLKGAQVEAQMLDIDFNFGANIFMLGEYESEEKNRLYEEKFLALFNSASVPLYWEGTEPREGYLRYDRDTPRDVYRRPPGDAVRDFCKEKGLHMKGHPLFWHEFIPHWLPDDFKELKLLIVKRFGEIAERYRDDVEMFDVVNEPSRIYDVYMRDRRQPGRKSIVPEEDYCVWVYDLARKYFPANKLIFNDTVKAAFDEFHGKYSCFYLTAKDLIGRGVPIDEIGLQCHCSDDRPRNVYDTECLYDVLDTYASLGKTLNISEISIPSRSGGEDISDLQKELAVRLYKACFSHEAMTGITWWNLPDDGILVTKRVAVGENLPSTGLLDPDYNEKPAYKALKKLIREDWRTDAAVTAGEGVAKFRGFYGTYKVTVTHNGKTSVHTLNLSKKSPPVRKLQVK